MGAEAQEVLCESTLGVIKNQGWVGEKKGYHPANHKAENWGECQILTKNKSSLCGRIGIWSLNAGKNKPV